MTKEKNTVSEKAEKEVTEERDLYGELNRSINENRGRFREQLAQVKDHIETRKNELDLLQIKKSKLEGAIEASDMFLKAVLPSTKK